jgi:hypothetical protein
MRVSFIYSRKIQTKSKISQNSITFNIFFVFEYIFVNTQAAASLKLMVFNINPRPNQLQNWHVCYLHRIKNDMTKRRNRYLISYLDH